MPHQMLQAWQPILGLSRRRTIAPSRPDSRRCSDYEDEIRQARDMLDQLEREDRIGIVMLGRVYHHDPGLNHEIMEEFQKLGYPIFSQSTLPLDEDHAGAPLRRRSARGGYQHIRSTSATRGRIRYSCSTNHKVWAAKFTARHPNLVALEISSFKCGHDAPIYGVIEGIIEQSGTPYFCFKDLDENKPSGSIKMRWKRFDYFLRRYREEVIRKRKAEQDIDAQLAALEARLRSEMSEADAVPFEQGSWEREAQGMTAD